VNTSLTPGHSTETAQCECLDCEHATQLPTVEHSRILAFWTALAALVCVAIVIAGLLRGSVHIDFMVHSTLSEASMYVLGFGLVLGGVIGLAVYLYRHWHNQEFKINPQFDRNSPTFEYNFHRDMK